jgi:plasmid stabilization system protein ParE
LARHNLWRRRVMQTPRYDDPPHARHAYVLPPAASRRREQIGDCLGPFRSPLAADSTFAAWATVITGGAIRPAGMAEDSSGIVVTVVLSNTRGRKGSAGFAAIALMTAWQMPLTRVCQKRRPG